MTEATSQTLAGPAPSAVGLAELLRAGATPLAEILLELIGRVDLPLAVKDATTSQYRYVNARMAALFGSSPEAMIGTDDTQWLEASQWPSLRTAENAALAMPRGALTEHKLELGGTRREFSVARVAWRDGRGTPVALCSLWMELTAQRQTEAKLLLALSQLEQQQQAAEVLRRETQDQSLRDAVTGLYQKIHFEDQLRREVDLSSREHREFSLVSIELDPLSDEARAMGPLARARVLEALGRLLRGNTRAMDASCRLDESRFAVLLSGVGLATAHSRMEGLRRQCATQIVVLEGRNIGFSVSMGVASFPHTAHTQEALVDAAETALAEARKRGGNHVTLASIRFELE
ncbi:sensor domain-containing diguanylate cyclase [uncultured Piscinibacter sp.]|uniref:sensor domain-containing diguanylate cyclase n=1 Tax=uncultured Piscinibacter sp. TaxID=1131835 RepID=UPI00261B23A6|nr:sensor domain-containing diguanylate cyclase [uncultured Piscinibacter sp.]